MYPLLNTFSGLTISSVFSRPVTLILLLFREPEVKLSRSCRFCLRDDSFTEEKDLTADSSLDF